MRLSGRRPTNAVFLARVGGVEFLPNSLRNATVTARRVGSNRHELALGWANARHGLPRPDQLANHDGRDE